jgi:hypothetical protein
MCTDQKNSSKRVESTKTHTESKANQTKETKQKRALCSVVCLIQIDFVFFTIAASWPVPSLPAPSGSPALLCPSLFACVACAASASLRVCAPPPTTPLPSGSPPPREGEGPTITRTRAKSDARRRAVPAFVWFCSCPSLFCSLVSFFCSFFSVLSSLFLDGYAAKALALFSRGARTPSWLVVVFVVMVYICTPFLPALAFPPIPTPCPHPFSVSF